MDEVPAKIKNPRLYKKVKKEIYKKNPKHSAYRSLQILKEYKKQGGQIDESKKRNGLTTWLNEKWINLTPFAEGSIRNISQSPKCGTRGTRGTLGTNQKGPSICRPSKKVNKDTPKLAQNFSKKQIQKALEIKKSGNRIDWNKL